MNSAPRAPKPSTAPKAIYNPGAINTVSAAAVRAWIDAPQHGAFTMPVIATLALFAPHGCSGNSLPLVKLTAPDGTVREIKSVPMNERGRTHVGLVEAGTLVEPSLGLHAQVAVAMDGGYEWRTIAVA